MNKKPIGPVAAEEGEAAVAAAAVCPLVEWDLDHRTLHLWVPGLQNQ